MIKNGRRVRVTALLVGAESTQRVQFSVNFLVVSFVWLAIIRVRPGQCEPDHSDDLQMIARKLHYHMSIRTGAHWAREPGRQKNGRRGRRVGVWGVGARCKGRSLAADLLPTSANKAKCLRENWYLATGGCLAGASPPDCWECGRGRGTGHNKSGQWLRGRTGFSGTGSVEEETDWEMRKEGVTGRWGWGGGGGGKGRGGGGGGR